MNDALESALRDTAGHLTLDTPVAAVLERGDRTRRRQRRQGAAVVAAVALVGAASFGVAAMSPGDQSSSVPFATSTPLATQTPTAPPASPSYSPDGLVVPEGAELTDNGLPPASPSGGVVVPEGADLRDYGLLGVLVAEPVPPNAQDKVRFYYCSCNPRPKLTWQPADAFSTYDLSDAPRTATIDGDPAWIVRQDGTPSVVGPVRDGVFLTFTATNVTESELLDMAASIHRAVRGEK